LFVCILQENVEHMSHHSKWAAVRTRTFQRA